MLCWVIFQLIYCFFLRFQLCHVPKTNLIFQYLTSIKWMCFQLQYDIWYMFAFQRTGQKQRRKVDVGHLARISLSGCEMPSICVMLYVKSIFHYFSFLVWVRINWRRVDGSIHVLLAGDSTLKTLDLVKSFTDSNWWGHGIFQ